MVLFALNALSAKAFGEAEFWFASIKVIAIILFIVLGGAAMFGWIDMKGASSAPAFSNFLSAGWFPNGFTALFVTMIAVNFSFQGTELIGIASGESEDPEKPFRAQSSKRYGVHSFSLCSPLVYWRL